QELVWRPDVIPNIVQTDMRLEGGNLYSGGSPGLGGELDEEAALAHPYQPQDMRILRREDNSASDWSERPAARTGARLYPSKRRNALRIRSRSGTSRMSSASSTGVGSYRAS